MDDVDAPARGPTILLHLPKTAGTTLRHVVRRMEPPGTVLELDSGAAVDEFRTWPVERRVAPRVVVGHLQVGLHELLPGPPRYVTVLREPVDRVVSHHAYVRAEPAHGLHETVRDMPFAEYALSDLDPQVDNGQVRLLSSLGHDPRPCGEEHLREAELTLRDLCVVVGTSEDFLDVLTRLSLLQGWPALRYLDRNVSPERPPVAALPADVREAVAERNRFDVALHRLAGELAREQAERLGDAYTAHRRALQRRNDGAAAATRHLVRAASRARRRLRLGRP